MADNDRCKQLAILCDETTHKTDYRPNPLEPYVKYRWPSERVPGPLLPASKEHDYICPETLTKLRRDRYVPMDMMWRPRPIIDAQADYCHVPKDTDWKKEEVIKSRPRVYMGTAVSIDDVEDPNDREMLLSYMYNTDSKRTLKEVQDYIQTQSKKNDKACGNIVKATVPCVVRNEGVVRSRRTKIPPIDPALRDTYEEWDRKQTRATVNSTVHYWTKFYENPKPAESMYSLIPAETVDRITHLIENNKLRLPHEKRPCGYTGSMPQITCIDVERIDLPMEHPMHTTNESVYVNHFDHANNHYEK